MQDFLRESIADNFNDGHVTVTPSNFVTTP